MNKEKLKELNIILTPHQEQMFELYKSAFLEQNAKVNLISKNDEKYLFEKHIYDSLAINLFLNSKQTVKLLDIGTGGGFPAIPIAILFDKIQVYPLDSIQKKIKAIECIKTKLNLTNVYPICDRVENIDEKFDIITSRAVASLDKILTLGATKLKKNGYFIAYKSLKTSDEIKEADKTIKKLKMKLVKNIEYKLPLTEAYTRNLVILKKV